MIVAIYKHTSTPLHQTAPHHQQDHPVVRVSGDESNCRYNIILQIDKQTPSRQPKLLQGGMFLFSSVGWKAFRLVKFLGCHCWHGIWPDGLCGFRPKAAGMRPVACGPHGPPPAPMPSRASPGSDARCWSPDVILGFAEYALSFPIYLPVFLSLFAL